MMVSCTVPPVHDTVTLPVRVSVAALAATVMVSVALSEPDVADSVIQLESDDAVQAQEPWVRVSVTVD